MIASFQGPGTGPRPPQFELGQPLYAVISEGADAPSGPATPYSLGAGSTFRGSVGVVHDTDFIRVQLTAGQTYRFEMDGLTLPDSYLQLRDAGGAVVAANDDSGSLNHSEITLTASRTGTFYLVAGAYDREVGTYSLTYDTVRPTGPNHPLTMTEIADYLREGFWQDRGQPARSYDVAQGGVLSVDMTDLSGAEQQVARMALDAWTGVTGIRFNTTSQAGAAANILFSNDDPRGAYSAPTAGYGPTVTASIVNIPVSWRDGPGEGYASYYYQTYIHEIGHALGLGHAGNYNGSATYGTDNHYSNDSWQATVMSYFSQTDNTAVNASYAYVVTPMIADIIAMQDMYGGSRNINGGNSVWGEGSAITGAFGMANRLMVQREAVTMTIFDQGGNDWLKLGSDRNAQAINLTDGTVSNVYGRIGNLSIAEGTIIENVIAGAAGDRINGNASGNWIVAGGGDDLCRGFGGNDTLEGGAGADRLAGGVGNDLYIADARDIIVEAAGEGIDRVRATINYALDVNVEALLLIQSFAKFGAGNAAANTIVGNSQVNYLSGGAGNDTVFGMAGNDTLAGNAGADRLVGGLGNDTYIRDGLDTIVETGAAQGGYDTVMTGADIVLGAGLEKVVVTGDRAVRVTGNGLDNLIVGNAAVNTLAGGGGDDVLFGGGGADIFVFAAGQGGRVGDFQNDVDLIRIGRGTSPGLTAAAVLGLATETDGGVNLTVGGGTLRIDGTTIAALQDDLIIG